MNYEKLEKIYEDFCEYQKERYVRESKNWFGAKNIKLSEKQRRNMFEMYYRYTFVEFWGYVRKIIYARKNVFDIVEKSDIELWDLSSILHFLSNDKIIKVRSNGKVVLLDKELKKYLTPLLTKEEIEKILSKKLKMRLSTIKKKPVSVITKLILKKEFSYNAEYDQMPLSIESAVTIVERIVNKYPFYDGFLFVGDDDLISIMISLVIPGFSSIVIDIDENLLDNISELSKRIRAKIKTLQIDIKSGKKVSDNIMGFLANPPYTTKGVILFSKFGINHFGKRGGYAFIVFGDESIGTKKLFIQEFFTKNNLIYEEIVNEKIGYPYNKLHKEDVENLELIERLGVSKSVIKSSYQLGAYLHILKYIPWKVKYIEPKGMKIYSYI